MELGIGQKYMASVRPLVLPNTAGAAFDIFTLTAAAAIPLYIEQALLSAGQTSAQILEVQAVIRSTAGSGGATTNSLISQEPTSSPNPACSLSYNVTTPGTLVKAYDPQEWDQFAAWEFTRQPGGFLLLPGQTFALWAPGGTQAANATTTALAIKIVEVK